MEVWRDKETVFPPEIKTAGDLWKMSQQLECVNWCKISYFWYFCQRGMLQMSLLWQKNTASGRRVLNSDMFSYV